MWGPQTYADWALLSSCAGLLSLGEIGLNVYFGNEWQKAHANNDQIKFRRIVNVALACSIFMACLLGTFALVALLSVDLRKVLSISVLSRNESLIVFCLLGMVSLSRIARGVITQIYRGRGEFARSIIIDQVFVGSAVVFSIAGALLGATPVILAVLYFSCDLIAGWAFIVRDVSRRWPDIELWPRLPTPTELTETWQHVRWLTILNGTANGWAQLPIILLGSFGITGNALVSFVVLRTLANLARQFAKMLALSSGVEIAMIHYAGRSHDVTRQLGIVGRILSLTTVAICVGVVFYGEPFVALWTGNSTLFDPRIAVPLFIAMVITAPALPLLIFGMYGNSFTPLTIASLVQLALGLTGCALLIGPYGGAGAAVGLAIGEAIGQGAVLPMLISRRAGVRYFHYAGQCVVVMILTALWCGTVGFALSFVIDAHKLPGLIASALLWSVIGFLPAFAVVLPTNQRNTIARHLWPRASSSTAISKSSS